MNGLLLRSTFRSDYMLTYFYDGHFLLLASFTKHDFVGSIGRSFEFKACHRIERIVVDVRPVQLLHYDVHCLALLDRRQEIQIFLPPKQINCDHYVFVGLRSQYKVCILYYFQVVLFRNSFVEKGRMLLC